MTRRDRNDICLEIKAKHGYCKRVWNNGTQKWEHAPGTVCCASPDVPLEAGKTPKTPKLTEPSGLDALKQVVAIGEILRNNPKRNAKIEFGLGKVVGTPAACDALLAEGVSAASLYLRHKFGDWGEGIGEEDWKLNDQAATPVSGIMGGRVLSSYLLPKTGVKIWVITEADRSVTTLMLPEEY